MNNNPSPKSSAKKTSAMTVMALALMGGLALMVAPDAFAQAAATPGGAFAAACDKVNTFFTSFQTILKVISAAIVTIAIVFAGYQIAFAHKRISDVAPILIGGLLIGGAATIASWFVEGFGEDDCAALLLPQHEIQMIAVA